ncbi:glucan endo-1,3-beta-glucosidase [Dermatophagoides farinae]|uniref:Glucan endo-1 n=1 Tax=Dermatophagoides farinae TaxID=6954 RepID=A0A922IBP5_DERFA|nr:glucan endo-1,3-beta-glucosidase-like [Dermatophagoides farinae]KAH7641348.1 glucan endo-1 [Dermatophagoides farinae]KAH9527115.1 hypothetical protein DERF_001158 [Dermatophagoides farinae]
MNLNTFMMLSVFENIIQPSLSSAINGQRKNLIWNDEFDNTDRLNDNEWIYEQHCGRFNKELQCYTRHRTKNVRIENGHLIIEACVEPFNGYNFTSGRLLTRKAWKYGRFEIRARMPYGYQLWPAIWMLAKHETYGGWPTNGEIDIAEIIGNTADLMSSSVHYGPTEKTMISMTSGVKNFSIDLSKSFHSYTLDWTSKQLLWLLDDQPYYSVNLDRMMCCNDSNIKSPYNKKGQPFDQPFFLILNVAVGGTFFGPPPYVTPEQAKYWRKNTMEIDYIRIFQ